MYTVALFCGWLLVLQVHIYTYLHLNTDMMTKQIGTAHSPRAVKWRHLGKCTYSFKDVFCLAGQKTDTNFFKDEGSYSNTPYKSCRPLKTHLIHILIWLNINLKCFFLYIFIKFTATVVIYSCSKRLEEDILGEDKNLIFSFIAPPFTLEW